MAKNQPEHDRALTSLSDTSCASQCFPHDTVFYMTLQSSPRTSLTGPSSGPSPPWTCTPRPLLLCCSPAARDAISRAESCASIERYEINRVSSSLSAATKERTRPVGSGKQTALVKRDSCHRMAKLLLFCWEQVDIPQTSEQELEKVPMREL
jgi:hypothetical protein